MVAVAVVELAHVPPGVLLVNVSARPTQALLSPTMASGSAFTVTSLLTKQPEAGNVYLMVEVPGSIPVTIPDVPTVAMPVLPLLHAPPVEVVARVVVALSHTIAVPVMALGMAFTDTR